MELPWKRSRKNPKTLYGKNRPLCQGGYDASLAVRCHNGTFVGKRVEGVRVFKGIPFALPPVGELRWKPPCLAPSGEGVYEAYYYGKSCIQTETRTERASLNQQGEDCLTLNIWANEGGPATPRPVMVFIHGGAYGWGGSSDPLYDGLNFARRQKDVVLVTINYRIGIFGFMDFSQVEGGGAYAQSGNLGLLDQVCALKWVQKNIRSFGGDPELVTLFGESAGAGSVSLLPLIQEARGLFSRVVAQSGSIAFTYSRREARTLTRRFLTLTGAKNMQDLLDLDEESIIKVNEALNEYNNFPERDGVVLPLNLYKAYRQGEGAQVDMLIGTNADETRYWIGELGSFPLYCFVAPILVRTMISRFRKEDRARAQAFMALQKKGRVWNATEFFNELVFRIPSVVQAAYHSDQGGRCYMYYWTKPSDIPHYGACHAVELSYVFGNVHDTIYTGKRADKALSDTVQDMWVRFAKTGDPSTPSHPWERYERVGRRTMVLGDQIHMVSDPKKEQRVLVEPLLAYRCNGNYDTLDSIRRYLKEKLLTLLKKGGIYAALLYALYRFLPRRKK